MGKLQTLPHNQQKGKMCPNNNNHDSEKTPPPPIRSMPKTPTVRERSLAPLGRDGARQGDGPTGHLPRGRVGRCDTSPMRRVPKRLDSPFSSPILFGNHPFSNFLAQSLKRMMPENGQVTARKKKQGLVPASSCSVSLGPTSGAILVPQY